MKTKEAAKLLGVSERFLREATAQGNCDLGFWAKMPGSSRRTFYFYEDRIRKETGKWKTK